jgi:hypothetical protein
MSHVSHLREPHAALFSHDVVRASDLSALWNMKSFARHRLLQEPDALDSHATSMPMSKL